MIWVLAIACVGLGTILAQVLMVYQKRADELRMRQEPLRQRIRGHLREIQEATARIRRTATRGLEELDQMVAEFKKDSAELDRGLQEVDRQFSEEGFQAPPEQELAQQQNGESAQGGEDTPYVRLREARKKREELDGHLAAVSREVESARRNLAHLEAKVEQRTGVRSR